MSPLPCLVPIIIVQFIMRMGNILTQGFEKVFLLYSPLTYDKADIISTYIYRQGLELTNYSYGTAVGLFNSAVNLLILVFVNYTSKKDYSGKSVVTGGEIMIENRSPGDRIFIGTVYIITGLMALMCLYPMLHVLFASISDPIRLMQHTGVILKPLGFSLEGYKIVLKNPNIPVSYLNTIIYVAVGTSINILMTTLGAYALSRKGYMFKNDNLAYCFHYVILTAD